MKVLNIITGFEKGGAEKTLYKLNIYALNQLSFFNISLTNIGYYGKMLKKRNLHVKVINVKKNIFKIYELLIFIKKNNPSVIQTWMYHSNFISIIIKLFFPKIKIFWNMRATYDPKKHTFYNRFFLKSLSFFSYFVPYKIICCSSKVKENFRDHNFSKSKLIVVNNGYDLEELKFNLQTKKSLLKRFKVNKNYVNFGMASRYNSQKDYDTLFNAFKKINSNHPNTNLFLAGEGNTKENNELILMIKKYKLTKKVKLLGFFDIVDFFNLIDIHVLSSSHGEGFPNVVAESMCFNVLTIATDIGEAKNIIGNFGYISKPENPNDLFNVMKECYKKIYFKNDLKYFFEGSRQRIKINFSIDTMIKNYIYEWKN